MIDYQTSKDAQVEEQRKTDKYEKEEQAGMKRIMSDLKKKKKLNHST